MRSPGASHKVLSSLQAGAWRRRFFAVSRDELAVFEFLSLVPGGMAGVRATAVVPVDTRAEA